VRQALSALALQTEFLAIKKFAIIFEAESAKIRLASQPLRAANFREIEHSFETGATPARRLWIVGHKSASPWGNRAEM